MPLKAQNDYIFYKIKGRHGPFGPPIGNCLRTPLVHILLCVRCVCFRNVFKVSCILSTLWSLMCEETNIVGSLTSSSSWAYFFEKFFVKVCHIV